MADETKLIISIETILRNLDRTLSGLKKVEQQLKNVANVKPNTSNFAKTSAAATQSCRAQVDQAKKTAREIERINAQTTRNAAREEAIRQRAIRVRTAVETREAKRGADSFIKSLKDQERAAGAFNARVQTLGNSLRSLGQGAASLGFGLTAAISVPLIAIGKSSLDAAVTIDSLKRGLTAIVGSADEAGKQLTRLTEIAKLPGIGFEEAIQGSIRLQAVGFSAADAEKALIQFSNAVALTGGGREELSRITVQLGQLAAKGKVLSQDLRPIIEAAPAVGRALKQAFGTVNADDIAALTTNSREFLDTLTKELERLPRAAAGARNTFENFRDTVFRASAAIGDALIPVLTKLIDFSAPIIIKLAEAFKQLPAPIQTIAVLMGAMTAAAGPLLIGLGLLTTGVGRLAVGLAQLSTLGILPSIASLKAFNVAAVATIARLTGLRAATIAAAGPWVALATAIGVVAAAILLIDNDELTAATEDQLKSTKKLIDQYEEEIGLLSLLKSGISATADDQERLLSIYKALGIQTELRIKSIQGEKNQMAALRTELVALQKEEKERLRIQGASIAGKFAQDLQKLVDLQNERLGIERKLRIAEQTDTGLIADAAQLVKRHGELNDELKTQQELVQQGASGLKVYEQVSERSVESAFRLARTLGGLDGVTVDVTNKFKQFTEAQRDAVPEVKTLTDSLRDQTRELLKAGDAAGEAGKRRKGVVGAAVSLAQEASSSLQGALKFMNAFIAAQPDLRVAIEKEAQLAGKTFDEFVKDSLGLKGDKAGTSVRNAQEALADALAKLAENSAENQIAIEKSKNKELLRLNDSRFRQELISYQEFIGERSRLQQIEIQGEIDRQRKIAELAAADAARQQQRAGVTKGAEAIRARAAERQSLAKKVEAETKILDLQSRQKDIASDAENDLREFNRDRLKDFRELSRELDEILGKEKAAGEAAVDERFRDTLRELSNEKKSLLKRETLILDVKVNLATLRGVEDEIGRQIQDTNTSLERREELLTELNDFNEQTLALEKKLATLQGSRSEKQIDDDTTFIENAKKRFKGVVALRAAQEEISRAEERQLNLERDLAFQVNFRGLSERQAVQQRLEGEKLVRAEILKQQASLEAVIATLQQAGLEIPLGLIEGVKRFEVVAKGLGESSFSEQFKLAEIDLGKVADELGNKIADVERAIRSRTISEVEGRLIIRRLNGEYVGELEKQLEVLKEIAAASGDESLRRQAASAQQSVRDTRAAADELENFSAQLESVAVDSFADSLSQLFKDLRDNTESATQDILNFLNNIAARVGDFIAENFARQIAESLFPDPSKGGSGGLLSTIKGLFGFGGGDGAATGALGVTAASTTFSTSVATSAVTFATTVTAAGAAFAATVAGSAIGSSVGSSLAGFAGFARGDIIIPAAPNGRVIRVAEGGHPEAVLTSDPRYALQQAAILRQFLRMTRGLSGHFKSVPEFAEGGIITARDAEANLLASLASSRTPSLASLVPTELAGRGDSSPSVNFRNINLFDRREMVRGHLRSAEGARDILNVISENADEIGRRIRVR